MIRYFNRQICFICLFLLIVVILYWSGIAHYLTLERIQHHAETLRIFVHRQYMISVFVYCFCFIVATLLSLPVTIILSILGGYLYGILPGTFYATLSATFGSILLFLLVRYFFGNMVQKLFFHQVERFWYKIQKHGYSYVLMLQLLPITPTPLINIVAGLSPLSLGTFVWTTFIGMLPGTLIYAIAGQQLAYIRSVNDILSWPMISILTVFALLMLLIPYALYYIGLAYNR
ncbi:TVP38/TMEM64 family protein [Candidatus Dependentiae bacterium]|nr:MAG: TVP38/TMEM64 family protein [Candidatus Dependentiae bacterium]